MKARHVPPCLTKALRFDGRFAPAWVAYGHAFAQHDESDQALAASLGPTATAGTWGPASVEPCLMHVT